MKGKNLLCLALVTLMLLGVVMINPVGAPSTTIGVEPDSIVDPALGPGSTFTVEIWIRDVVDLAGLEFKLGYDTSVLTATSITDGGIFASPFPLISNIDDAAGFAHYSVMEGFGLPGFTGDGLAAIIDFEVDDVGDSVLDLYNTKLGDPSSPPVPIDHEALDGYFSNVAVVPTHDLTIAVDGSGSTDPAVGVHTYDEGTDVDVTATPDSGWTFDHWVLDGADAGSVNPIMVTMDADHSLTAFFTEIVGPTHDLTIDVVGSGSTDPAPGVHSYAEDTPVDVDAIPDSGWMLDHWELDGVDVGSADPYTVTMDSDHALTAFFVEAVVLTHDLTIAVDGSGSTDPAVGVHTYDEGTDVDVTATPDSGWTLDHWELDGVDVGDANPYSVTMDADHALTAVFTEITLPPVETIDDLIDLVEAFYGQGEIDEAEIRTSLIDKLTAAKAKIDAGKTKPAKNILGAFINHLEAQRGKHVSTEAADILIADAQFIINNL